MHPVSLNRLVQLVFFFNSGNGYITTDVLMEIFRELDNTITEDDLETMIEEIDSDGSGTVDFDGMFFVSFGDREWLVCIIV